VVRGDLTLARAVERCEIEGMRACIESAQRLAPSMGAQGAEIAGGLAIFAGVDSPLSQAIGMGSSAAVTSDDVERVTAFYAERDSTPSVLVNPTADAKLSRLLAQAGYGPVQQENALIADLSKLGGGRDPRIADADDPQRWAETSARGFLDGAEPSPEYALVGWIIAAADGCTPLEGRGDDGGVAATGAMDVQGEFAGFFASSTLPAFRRCGWQRALILDRIARARAAGARYGRASAGVGGPSERNFLRCGFAALYTRTLWQLPRSRS